VLYIKFIFSTNVILKNEFPKILSIVLENLLHVIFYFATDSKNFNRMKRKKSI